MITNIKLFWLVLGTILIVGGAVFWFGPKMEDKKINKMNEPIILAAQSLYRQKVRMGEDLSSGPCLTNDLQPNWVVDIVHRPRQDIDDLPYNQCPAFLEGRAKYVVELDLEGKLVRIK